jgi:hypothetical protein
MTDNVTYLDNCATRLQLDTLAGFFCSDYGPVTPPVRLAKSFGQFLNWSKEEGEEEQIWMVTDGTRLPVAGSEELAALGAVADDVRHPDQLKWKGTLPPRDGALFRELRSDAVFLYAGGAPFHVPEPTSLESFGGEGAVRTVPAKRLQTLARPPRESTLLRELSDSKVFLIEAGKRHWLSTRIERAKHGGAASVRVVPDGALTSIPQGLRSSAGRPDHYRPRCPRNAEAECDGGCAGGRSRPRVHKAVSGRPESMGVVAVADGRLDRGARQHRDDATPYRPNSVS